MPSAARTVLDCGAGTGYYAARLLNEDHDRRALALDVSVAAIRRAARAHERMAAVVADAWRPLPIADGVVDVIVSVFAPRNPAEFHRVLAPGGSLITVVPWPEHLVELRRPLGLLDVEPAKTDRLDTSLAGFFRRDATHPVRFREFVGHHHRSSSRPDGPERLPRHTRGTGPAPHSAQLAARGHRVVPVRGLEKSDAVRILILGGTAWLGRTVAALAVAEGHDAVCLARGVSGAVPSGASLVVGERDRPDAYDVVSGQSWDAVIDVSRQPSHVREALQALSATTRHWVFVSTCNVYADASRLDGDESDPLLEPLPVDEPATPETYGAGKVACELSVLEHRGSQGALIARAGLIGGPDEPFDRCGYWPWRFARPAAPDGAVLVPDVPELITSVIDVRDLARFLLDAATRRISGVFDTVGERLPLEVHCPPLSWSRAIAGRWSRRPRSG